MFVLRIVSMSGVVSLFRGTYDATMGLAHALERFPVNVVQLSVHNTDSLNLHYFWASPT
jgi:hypothetical protein